MGILNKTAPQFTADALVNGESKKLSLSDYAGKYVVLFFYPLDFTFVCPTEIIAFSEAASKFAEINTVILGCSVDSVFTHLAFANTPRKSGGLGGCNYPLISDQTHSISRAYDVLCEDGVAYRGLFIIDTDQKVRIMQVNDLAIGRSVDETLRLVKALQFTDKHGEVCPANWQEGGQTIKANTKDSAEYFQSAN